MKDTERERTTAELAAWQLRHKQKLEEETQLKLQNQRENQNKEKVSTEEQRKECAGGGKVKQSEYFSSVIEYAPSLLGLWHVGEHILLLGLKKHNASNTKKKQVDLPAPRSAGNIQVTFTPRVFPTALRESRVQEEEEVRAFFFFCQHVYSYSMSCHKWYKTQMSSTVCTRSYKHILNLPESLSSAQTD